MVNVVPGRNAWEFGVWSGSVNTGSPLATLKTRFSVSSPPSLPAVIVAVCEVSKVVGVPEMTTSPCRRIFTVLPNFPEPSC